MCLLLPYAMWLRCAQESPVRPPCMGLVLLTLTAWLIQLLLTNPATHSLSRQTAKELHLRPASHMWLLTAQSHLNCVHTEQLLTFELKPYLKKKKPLLRAGSLKRYFHNEGSLPQR